MKKMGKVVGIGEVKAVKIKICGIYKSGRLTQNEELARDAVILRHVNKEPGEKSGSSEDMVATEESRGGGC